MQNFSSKHKKSWQSENLGKVLTNSDDFSYCDESEKTTTKENNIMTYQGTKSVKVKFSDQLVAVRKKYKEVCYKTDSEKIKDASIDNSFFAQNDLIGTHSENKTISLTKDCPINNFCCYKK